MRDTKLLPSPQRKVTSAGARRRRSVGEHTRRDVILTEEQPVLASADLNRTQIQRSDSQYYKTPRKKIVKRLVERRKKSVLTGGEGGEVARVQKMAYTKAR